MKTAMGHSMAVKRLRICFISMVLVRIVDQEGASSKSYGVANRHKPHSPRRKLLIYLLVYKRLGNGKGKGKGSGNEMEMALNKIEISRIFFGLPKVACNQISSLKLLEPNK